MVGQKVVEHEGTKSGVGTVKRNANKWKKF